MTILEWEEGTRGVMIAMDATPNYHKRWDGLDQLFGIGVGGIVPNMGYDALEEQEKTGLELLIGTFCWSRYRNRRAT